MDHDRGAAEPATQREQALVAVMARLAEGDRAGVLTLREHFRPELAAAVRRVARRRHAALDADAVDELVTDLALELGHLAGAWDPAGAPPWVWARHRVALVVDRHLGQWTRPLDQAGLQVADRGGPPPPGEEPAVLEVLDGLANRVPEVALLREAVGRVASERDQVIFFETAVQSALGDRSPAATVAGLMGIRPEAVRQQARRVRLRVQRLAADEPRFAVLADLSVVA